MKRVIAIILIVVAVALFWQLFRLILNYRELSGLSESLSLKLSALKIDSNNLKADLEYFSDPANLEKELRSRFNYKNPGEKLIIIVPPKDNN